MRQRVLEEWNSYREKVVPKDAGEVQTVETRRAFYAGAMACLAIIVKDGMDGHDEEDMVEVLHDLNGEFRLYQQRMLGGAM